MFKNITVALSATQGNLPATLRSSAAQVKTWERQVQSTSSNVAGSNKLMATSFVALGVAVAAGLAYSIAKAIEFDKEMRNVNSLMHLSEEQFASLEKQVISMSTRLPQSASVLAQGLYDITSSGFSGAQGLKVLDAAATAASAGLTDTATSGKAITAVLNAYGLQAKDAADVSDTLFQTVNLGVISFGELSSQIGDVVGTAASAKVQIDEVGAAIAAMTLSGISGAEATTSLNQLIISLVKPSEELTALYKQMGYESGAAALEQKGLYGVMKDIGEATDGDVTALLKLFPNIRASRGAFALLAAEGANYAKTQKGIADENNRAGATQAALNEQLKGTGAILQIMANKLNAVAIGVGVAVLPAFNDLLNGATDLGTSIGELVSELGQRLEPFLRSIVSVAGDLWELLTNLTAVLGPVIAGIGALVALPVIAFLNAFGSSLAAVTGFLADHEEIVMVVAAAYAIHLYGGITKVGQAIKVQIWYNAMLAKEGLAGMAQGAKGAGAALLSMGKSVGPLLAITLALEAFVGWRQGAKEAATAMRDFTDARNDFANSGDVAAFVDAIKTAQQTVADFQADQARFNSSEVGGWTALRNIVFDVGGAYADLSKGDTMAALADQAAQATNELNSMRVSADTYLRSQGAGIGDSSEEWLAKVDAFVQAGQKAGVDWTGTTAEIQAGLARVDAAGGKTADELRTDLVGALGDLESGAVDTQQAVDDLKDALDKLFGVQLSQEEATSNYEAALDDLRSTLRGTNHDLSLNTEAGRENRAAVRDATSALVDKIKADADAGVSADKLRDRLIAGREALIDQGVAAGYGRKQMEGLLDQYNLTPKLIKTLVSADTNDAQDRVDRLLARINNLHDKEVTITVTGKTAGAATGAAFEAAFQAFGGIMIDGVQRFAQGGSRLPSQGTIANNGANLVQWAEPGTGGEAFIPLGLNRRGRSMKVLEEVARRFGVGVTQYKDGGFHYPNFKYHPYHPPQGKDVTDREREQARKQYEKDKKDAYRQWKDDRYQAMADYHDRQVLKRQANAGLRSPYSSDVGGVFGGLQASAESRAQARAQLKADRSKNPYDDASDFYKKPELTTQKYTKALRDQVKATKSWGDDLSEISRKAGEDVSYQLEQMGDAGTKYVKMMADASTKDMKRMADAMRDLQFQQYTQGLASDTRAQTEFRANLLALTQRGQGALANELASMGYEAGGSLAAAAVKAPNKKLKRIANQLRRQDNLADPTFTQALTLAAALQGHPGLGIIGLATATGMGVADVVGLLSRFDGSVFSKLGGGAMRQVYLDQKLIASGKQPSGLGSGGIVSGGGTGLYYRWAEPGSGGESLIPLGPNHRPRARDLWAQTGRHLGMQVGGGSGHVTVVNVNAGAVHAEVRVAGSNATPEQIRRAAQQAVDSSLDSLIVKVRAGAGGRK